MLSTAALIVALRARRSARRLPALLLGLLLCGCATHLVPDGRGGRSAPARDAGAFVMPDGARLPYRVWLPDGPPRAAVMLALHGMNDSRDAWEYPAPGFRRRRELRCIAPDQRGFGAHRRPRLLAGHAGAGRRRPRDGALLHAAHPDVPLFLMGESMGAAVLMCLATVGRPPPVAGYVLVAPAVWGEAQMNVFVRSGLWLVVHTVPGLTVAGGGRCMSGASDNHGGAACGFRRIR